VLQEKLDEVSRGQEAAKERLKAQLKLRLGQRVLLKQDGHRGVVCGYAPPPPLRWCVGMLPLPP